jgi:hypothetical protein
VPEGQDSGTSSDLDLDHLLVPFQDANHHGIQVKTSQAPLRNSYLTHNFDGDVRAHSSPTNGMDEVPPTCTFRNTNPIILRDNGNNHTMRQLGHCNPALPTTVPQMSTSQEYPPYLRSSVSLGYSTGFPSPSSGLVSNLRHTYYQRDDFSQFGSDYM